MSGILLLILSVTRRVTFKRNHLYKHHKGVPYFLVDCNVTGVNEVQTATEPCSSLKVLWETVLISSIKSLVDVGGDCEGAQVSFQEEKTGPHINSVACIQNGWENFDSLDWKLELQAPNGPYINLLDLSILPIAIVPINFDPFLPSVSATGAPVLNLDPSGSPLTFKFALSGPFRPQ